MILSRTRDGKAALLVERSGVQRRLSHLMAVADGCDLIEDRDKLMALRRAMQLALRRIEDIDATLHPEIGLDMPKVALPRTPREVRQGARARLKILLSALHDLPEGCRRSAKLLRRSIRRELDRIERSRGRTT